MYVAAPDAARPATEKTRSHSLTGRFMKLDGNSKTKRAGSPKASCPVYPPNDALFYLRAAAGAFATPFVKVTGVEAAACTKKSVCSSLVPKLREPELCQDTGFATSV